ncbi:MAG: LysM peptidoglycan-binding domain-containing protein [Gammaproteobacteria bacterium]|nr:MAG: LysM peptidoglycan-binding domain-containing protein [Gammaproteobacteria bacterium]
MLVLVACAGGARRPAIPDYHVVRAGETLYAISQRYRLDYRELARWNGIGRSYRIHPGQRLRLNPPPGGRTVARRAKPAAAPPPVARTVPRASPDDPAHAPPPWRWPVDGGRVVGPVTQPSGGVGLRIDGARDQPVFAAADGKVAYTGSGLRGYGQLVIVNHVRGWLTAYGHNERLLVAEGDSVRAGQQIATMGPGPGQQPQLYFEIRLDGRPVDPLTQLPRR